MSAELQRVFDHNIRFFKRVNHPYFTKFIDYQPKRLTLRLSEQGYINLVNINTGQAVYPEDPVVYAEKQAAAFLKKRSHFVVTETLIDRGHPNYPYTEYLAKTNKKYEELLPPIVQADETLAEQLFMYGAGLCLQLQYVLNTLDVKNLTIFESDEDALFNSLYVVDWEQILGYFNRDGYSITVYNVTDNDENIRVINSLLKNKGYHRCSKIDTYFHYENDELRQLSNNLKFYFMNVLGGLGYFEDERLGLLHTLENVQKGMPISRNSLTMASDFCDKPVLVIGNGPSLDELEGFLKERLEQFIVISCGTALSTLVNKGIVPDIHVEQERITLVRDMLVEHTSQEQRDKLFFVGLNTCCPEVYELFNNTHMVMKPRDIGGDLLKQVSDNKFFEMYECNPLVSNFGLGLAIMLGFKEIYLAGVDCGMIDTAKHHSKQSIYFNENEEKAPVFRKRAIHSARGNFRDSVLTNPLFNNSRIAIESILTCFNPNCYNLSDGAYIRGAEPKPSDDVANFEKIENKASIIQRLLERSFENQTFDKHSIAVELDSIRECFDLTCNKIRTHLYISGMNYLEIANEFDAIEGILRQCEQENSSVYRILSGSIRGILVNITCAKKVFNDLDFAEFYAVVETEIDVFFTATRVQIVDLLPAYEQR
ncbi:MAG: DUF115 domain-containing protein [Pseudomonadales bacterium]|nr:DUF115 domain-containing protein [Pseudomonadales bacterium]NRA17338.1 motility associated factor glycosyltransferase family protein [Oceanospirillaceae bacterium]